MSLVTFLGIYFVRQGIDLRLVGVAFLGESLLRGLLALVLLLAHQLARKSEKALAAMGNRSRPAARRAAPEEIAAARETMQRLSTPWDKLFGALETAAIDDVALLGIEPDPKAGTVTITGDGKDYLSGDVGNDILSGDAGDDTINGGDGDGRAVSGWMVAGATSLATFRNSSGPTRTSSAWRNFTSGQLRRTKAR